MILLFRILWYAGPPIIRTIALTRPETTMEARRRQSMARKRKKMLFPKLYKQKCRVCGDHNLLCEGEQTKECDNCENAIVRGESQTGSIGMDGSFVGQFGGALQQECKYLATGKTSQLQLFKRWE